jgi:serine/threonine-protein phosphatase 6 regulatory subunit 3
MFVEPPFRLFIFSFGHSICAHFQWLSSENLIPRLAALLSPQHAPDLHAVVADVLKGIISMCAPSPNNPNDHQIALITNRFSRQLVSYDVVQTLVAFMLDGLPGGEVVDPELSESITAVPPDSSLIPAPASSQQPWDNSDYDSRSYSSESSSSSASEYQSAMSTATERSTSSLLQVSSVLIELMRKNNSDFFEPYLFHTLRHRLIQIQQQYLPQLDRSGMNPAQRIEADRNILEKTMAEMVDQMGIVHFGALLSALSARLHEFQALLVNPRSLVS